MNKVINMDTATCEVRGADCDNQVIPCPMTKGIICSRHCIGLATIIEKINNGLASKSIIGEDINDLTFYGLLSPELQKLASSKVCHDFSWESAIKICTACRLGAQENMKIGRDLRDVPPEDLKRTIKNNMDSLGIERKWSIRAIVNQIGGVSVDNTILRENLSTARGVYRFIEQNKPFISLKITLIESGKDVTNEFYEVKK